MLWCLIWESVDTEINASICRYGFGTKKKKIQGTEGAHSSEPQKAHLTCEFVVVTNNGGYALLHLLQLWSVSGAVKWFGFSWVTSTPSCIWSTSCFPSHWWICCFGFLKGFSSRNQSRGFRFNIFLMQLLAIPHLLQMIIFIILLAWWTSYFLVRHLHFVMWCPFNSSS